MSNRTLAIGNLPSRNASSRRIACFGLPLLIALVPGLAAAAAVPLNYRAPEQQACPSREQFTQALRARGADLDSEGAAERARAVDVWIRRVDGSYVGELIVHAREAGAASRTVHDADCSEVVSGLALTAAIALGGTGLAAVEPAPADAPKATQGPPSRADVGAPSRGELPAADGAGPSTPQSAEPERRLRGSSFGHADSMPVGPGTLRFDGARSYTLMAGGLVGLIPGKVMPRYELNASLASFLTPPGGDSRLFGPLLQVHWAALGPVTSRHSGDVALDTFGLEAGINSCSALTYDTRGWVALLCAEFGAGWLVMDATAPGSPQRSSEAERGYGYGGLGFDGQYNFGSWAHLGLRVGARLSTPVIMDMSDGTRLFESSPVAAYASVGFGLHF
jgi:hypothetical protein